MTSMARSSRARITERVRVALALMLVLACALPLPAAATQNDRTQQINVSAKSGEVLAKPNGISHLRGDVLITQGTLRITGANGTIHFDADSHISRVVLTGSPVHVQQRDDNGNLMKASANKVEYVIPTGVATLTGNAHVDQVGRGTASGDVLVYNTTTSTMTASSHGEDRVHMTFQPRQAPAAPTTQPAPAATTHRR